MRNLIYRSQQLMVLCFFSSITAPSHATTHWIADRAGPEARYNREGGALGVAAMGADHVLGTLVTRQLTEGDQTILQLQHQGTRTIAPETRRVFDVSIERHESGSWVNVSGGGLFSQGQLAVNSSYESRSTRLRLVGRISKSQDLHTVINPQPSFRPDALRRLHSLQVNNEEQLIQESRYWSRIPREYVAEVETGSQLQVVAEFNFESYEQRSKFEGFLNKNRSMVSEFCRNLARTDTPHAQNSGGDPMGRYRQATNQQRDSFAIRQSNTVNKLGVAFNSHGFSGFARFSMTLVGLTDSAEGWEALNQAELFAIDRAPAMAFLDLQSLLESFQVGCRAGALYMSGNITEASVLRVETADVWDRLEALNHDLEGSNFFGQPVTAYQAISEMADAQDQADGAVLDMMTTLRDQKLTAQAKADVISRVLTNYRDTVVRYRRDLNSPLDAQRNTAAHFIAAFGVTGVARRLVAVGLDFSKTNADGLTPLMVASIQGNPDLVRELVQGAARSSINSEAWFRGKVHNAYSLACQRDSTGLRNCAIVGVGGAFSLGAAFAAPIVVPAALGSAAAAAEGTAAATLAGSLAAASTAAAAAGTSVALATFTLGSLSCWGTAALKTKLDGIAFCRHTQARGAEKPCGHGQAAVILLQHGARPNLADGMFKDTLLRLGNKCDLIGWAQEKWQKNSDGETDYRAVN